MTKLVRKFDKTWFIFRKSPSSLTTQTIMSSSLRRTVFTSPSSKRQYFSLMYENLIVDRIQPTDSDMSCKSQKLMLYNGLMDHAHTGAYHLLPMGLRTVNKLKRLINESMTEIGAQEINMSCLSSADLWKKSGRWEGTGSELFKLKDRHGIEYCLGPTCEEVVTSLVASRSPVSYKRLPIQLYQMTRKFRDEMAPKYGLLRGREFEMKDLYTFDTTVESAMKTYEVVCAAYEKLFTRLQLKYVKVAGSTGTIGGSLSHEFHVIADIGQDSLLLCHNCGFASNEELLATPGDSSCPQCHAPASTSKGIEIGHSFLLGTKYSQIFNACYSDETKQSILMEMGCYGLGVTRIVAAAMETLSPEGRIRWPSLIAPYQICIIPQKDGHKSDVTSGLAEDLYDRLTSLPNLRDEVVLDDRTKLTIGKRLYHADRLGYPYIIVVGREALRDQAKFELIDVGAARNSCLDRQELLSYMSTIETVIP